MNAMLLLLTLAVADVTAQGAGTGLGVIIGEPTGISAKFWLGGNVAADAAAAWSFLHYPALHVHADVLHHNFTLFDVSPGVLPFYYGVGGRFKLAGPDNKARIGVRVPVGLEYLFEAAPVGLFLEAVPILDLVPATSLGLNGAVGARWYFR